MKDTFVRRQFQMHARFDPATAPLHLGCCSESQTRAPDRASARRSGSGSRCARQVRAIPSVMTAVLLLGWATSFAADSSRKPNAVDPTEHAYPALGASAPRKV